MEINDDLPKAYLSKIELVPAKLAQIEEFFHTGKPPEGLINIYIYIRN